MKNHNDIYKATVKDVDDPKKQGRMRLKIPSVHGDNLSAWAKPISPMFLWFPPEEEDEVYVRFIEGNTNRPVIIGQWYAERKTPIEEFNKEDYNKKEYKEQIKRKRIKTHAGHYIELSDIKDDKRILIETEKGHTLEFRDKLNEEEQHVELKTVDGHRIYVNDTVKGEEQILIKDLNGNKIQLDTAKNDLNILAQNNETKEIGNNEIENIAVDSTKTIGGNLTVNVTGNANLTATNVVVTADATTVHGLVHLASGGKPVARVDDEIEVEITAGSSAGVYTGKIITGSGKTDSG